MPCVQIVPSVTNPIDRPFVIRVRFVIKKDGVRNPPPPEKKRGRKKGTEDYGRVKADVGRGGNVAKRETYDTSLGEGSTRQHPQ